MVGQTSGFGPVGRDRSVQREGGKYCLVRVNLFSLNQIFLLTGTVRRPGPGGPTLGRVLVQAAVVRQSSVIVVHHWCTVAMLAAAVLALKFT